MQHAIPYMQHARFNMRKCMYITKPNRMSWLNQLYFV